MLQDLIKESEESDMFSNADFMDDDNASMEPDIGSDTGVEGSENNLGFDMPDMSAENIGTAVGTAMGTAGGAAIGSFGGPAGALGGGTAGGSAGAYLGNQFGEGVDDFFKGSSAEIAFQAGFKKEAQERGVQTDVLEAAGETALDEAGSAAIGAVGGRETMRRLADSKVVPRINPPDFLKGAPARIGGTFAGALASGLASRSLIDYLRSQES